MILERVLEPEVMDTEEEAEAYDHMDHSEVNRLLIDRFLELGGGPGLFLDVGTGPVQIPVEFVNRGQGSRMVAIDAAWQMLKRGWDRLEEEGLGDRVPLVLTDAKRMPFSEDSFDAVLSNSIVHHLPDPLPCFREIARVVKSGGAVLLRDLHRPKDEEELDHLVDTYAVDSNEQQRMLFRDSLHAAFTVEEISALLAEAGLGHLTVSMSSDRHWTAECVAGF